MTNNRSGYRLPGTSKEYNLLYTENEWGIQQKKVAHNLPYKLKYVYAMENEKTKNVPHCRVRYITCSFCYLLLLRHLSVKNTCYPYPLFRGGWLFVSRNMVVFSRVWLLEREDFRRVLFNGSLLY